MDSYKTIELQTNVSLAPYTTLQIGGRARFFVKAENENQVADAVRFATANEISLFVLGGGSNILVSDKGFDGLVVQIALTGISAEGELITAQAGEDWDEFVAYCVGRNLAGIECLSGIPGFIGGTPVQNVGAYGQEVSETIVSVRCLDRGSGYVVEQTNADCRFSYRTSIFNSAMRDRFIVLSVKYRLKQDGEPKITYKDLREYLARRRADSLHKSRPHAGVTLREAREAILDIRRSKSMVIDACDPNSRSAGSFFKNPIVSRSKLMETDLQNAPYFSIDSETVKIPAAWLIESAGFHKGFKLGNAGISTNHSLAIVNLGGAAAEEIIVLNLKIQSEVERRFGIKLQPEPIFVGF